MLGKATFTQPAQHWRHPQTRFSFSPALDAFKPLKKGLSQIKVMATPLRLMMKAGWEVGDTWGHLDPHWLAGPRAEGKTFTRRPVYSGRPDSWGYAQQHRLRFWFKLNLKFYKVLSMNCGHENMVPATDDPREDSYLQGQWQVNCWAVIKVDTA